MKKKLIVFCCILTNIIHARPVNISGLLSPSLLTQNIITTPTIRKKPIMNLSGRFSQAELSKIFQNKVPDKQMIDLSARLSANQLDTVINFITAKKQSRNVSSLINSKDLSAAINWKVKQKPRLNVSAFLVQNYLDPQYQAAFKILNDPNLQKEYEAQLTAIQTYFREYDLTPDITISKTNVITLPNMCCPLENENYTLCQEE